MRQTKLYRCIAKVGNNPNGSAMCIKHHVNNLVAYSGYLDNKHPDWRWFNVFEKESGRQIGSFTKNNRPSTKHI